MHVCVSVWGRMLAGIYLFVCACVRACVRAYVCERERERERVLAVTHNNAGYCVGPGTKQITVLSSSQQGMRVAV